MTPALVVDANILVRVAKIDDPRRDVCERLLVLDPSGPVRLAACAQTFIEFWAVATRPVQAENGLGLPPAEVDAWVGRFRRVLPLLDEPPNVFAL